MTHLIETMNLYGAEEIPFLFIIDFECKKPIIIPIASINPDEILYDIDGFTNAPETDIKKFHNLVDTEKYFIKSKEPVSFERYAKAFNFVQKNQREGNSYLTNLTFPTKIALNASLRDIFHESKATFKLYIKNKLVVFSPESFVSIKNSAISSYPMKGTIDADLPGAKEKIIANEKEFSEHVTIVDLIRNDLHMVATDVTVNRFRYLDTIHTSEKTLLQVSSEITGKLPKDYQKKIGSILLKLLPAGSICGAPKKKTVEIIKNAEQYDRGYYTGIFGYCHGSLLRSAVMIRFIEKIKDDFYYKSGGGITVYSNAEEEYQELLDKVYVPITGNIES